MKRVEGVDVARGVASLVMIQGHAYHGWVAAAHHDTASYRFTRVLGTLPLPAFLVLAGAAIGWRWHAALRRGEALPEVRRAVAIRGLQVMLWGYGSNLVYALLDGHDGLETLLRADVLQCIGACIVGSAACMRRGFTAYVAGAGVAVAVLCPWLSALHVGGPLRFLAALFVDVPGVTRMPLVPLFAWFALGVVAARAMIVARDGSEVAARAGTSGRVLVALFGLGLLMAVLGSLGTEAMLDALGGRLSRSHLAVWPNILDGGGRGLMVLATGAALSLVLPAAPRRLLVALGQSSLIAYVVHVPFCYGALAGPLRAGATMTQSTLCLVPLTILSVAAALGYRRLKRRSAR